jgi:hypothetical protein
MKARSAVPCTPVAVGDLLDNPYRNTAQAVKPAHLPVLGNAGPRGRYNIWNEHRFTAPTSRRGGPCGRPGGLARSGGGRQFAGHPCNRENPGQAQGLPLQLMTASPIHHPSVPRPIVHPAHRSTAPPIHRSTASPIHRLTASPIHRPTDSPIHRPTDSPIHRFTAPPIHRFTASPIHRSTDSPIHRFTAPPSIRRHEKPGNGLGIGHCSESRNPIQKYGHAWHVLRQVALIRALPAFPSLSQAIDARNGSVQAHLLLPRSAWEHSGGRSSGLSGRGASTHVPTWSVGTI